MIRQRLLFTGIMVAVVSMVASSGDVEARNCRCQGQRVFRQGNWGWRQNNGYYTQTNYAPAGQPMTTPTVAPDAQQLAPDANAPAPPSQAPAPAPASQPSQAPTT